VRVGDSVGDPVLIHCYDKRDARTGGQVDRSASIR
jgi:hypothetical protein